MSANPASAVQYEVDTDTAPLDDNNLPAGATAVEPIVQPVIPDEPVADRGVLGSIRTGIRGFAGFLSRYRLAITEVESQYREAWNGGRPGTKNPAGNSIPHSAPARILSEDGELLVEVTMREDANGSALLRLHEPKSLPMKALVQTSEGESGRPVAIKWAGGSSAIIEFL